MISSMVCLVVSAVLMIPGVARQPTEANRPVAQAGNESDWVTFNGTAKKSGDKYRLTAADKNGAIDAPD
jgi:hypothetical protein